MILYGSPISPFGAKLCLLRGKRLGIDLSRSALAIRTRRFGPQPV